MSGDAYHITAPSEDGDDTIPLSGDIAIELADDDDDDDDDGGIPIL